MRLKIMKASLGYDVKGNLTEGLILQKKYIGKLLSEDVSVIADDIKKLSFRLNGKRVPEGDVKIEFVHKRSEAQNEGGFSFQINVINPLLQGHMLQLEIVFEEKTGARNGGVTVQAESIRFKFWVHYAFRWFQRPQVVNEVNERRAYPWKISQRSTSLCGIACIFYFLIQDDPDTYERLLLRLHQYGYAHHNNYLILPNAYLHSINPEKDSQYPPGVAYVDWIALASVRNVESNFGYRGKVNQVASAINWPHILIKLSRNLLGYENTSFKLFSPIKTYIRDYLKDNVKLRVLAEEVDRSHQTGAKMILLVDSDMLHNRSHYHLKNFIQYHWVVYEGDLRFFDKAGKLTKDYGAVSSISFDIFSWGEEIKHSRTSEGISRNAFIRNYYGYIRIS